MDTGAGIGWGLVAAVSWGGSEVAAAILGRRIGSLRATAWIQGTALLTLASLLVLTGTPLPDEPWIVAAALWWGVVAGVAYLAFFAALTHGPVTVVSPIVAMFGGLSAVLAVAVLGESMGPVQAGGVAVAALGVGLASVVTAPGVRRPRFAGRGVAYALIALVLFAILTIGYAPVLEAGGWLPVLALARVSNAGTAWAVLLVRRRRGSNAAARATPSTASPILVPVPLGEVLEVGPEEPPIDPPRGRSGRTMAGGATAGVLDAAGFAAFATGLTLAPVWLVSVVSSFGPIVTVIAGVALFHERPQRLQWAGLALVLLSLPMVGSAG